MLYFGIQCRPDNTLFIVGNDINLTAFINRPECQEATGALQAYAFLTKTELFEESSNMYYAGKEDGEVLAKALTAAEWVQVMLPEKLPAKKQPKVSVRNSHAKSTRKINYVMVSLEEQIISSNEPIKLTFDVVDKNGDLTGESQAFSITASNSPAALQTLKQILMTGGSPIHSLVELAEKGEVKIDPVDDAKEYAPLPKPGDHYFTIFHHSSVSSVYDVLVIGDEYDLTDFPGGDSCDKQVKQLQDITETMGTEVFHNTENMYEVEPSDSIDLKQALLGAGWQEGAFDLGTLD